MLSCCRGISEGRRGKNRLFYISAYLGQDNNSPPTPTRAQSMGKGKNKRGNCQDLRCLLEATLVSQEGPTRFQNVRPQSSRHSVGFFKLESQCAPIRTQFPHPLPLITSLPVVQQPFCQSPADPARWRSAVPPGYQFVRSPFALRAPSKSTHH
ncbi:uncharacterized protein LOC111149850 [Enhydra lutris kenyoni]|uniref:Uncharacterized protein LOC111149850 n=1 Tax=Enhydra lutris kenyoni TaxID=391180 RepID=A0A2Y9JPF3_ENHLU|nr:uncharacterized protein LOC111149850 [Enhydra lutris kenyoni]